MIELDGAANRAHRLLSHLGVAQDGVQDQGVRLIVVVNDAEASGRLVGSGRIRDQSKAQSESGDSSSARPKRYRISARRPPASPKHHHSLRSSTCQACPRRRRRDGLVPANCGDLGTILDDQLGGDRQSLKPQNIPVSLPERLQSNTLQGLTAILAGLTTDTKASSTGKKKLMSASLCGIFHLTAILPQQFCQHPKVSR